jgi:hemerythrin-like domain-containing protein
MDRLQKITSTDEGMRLWMQFKQDIIPHMKGEEKYFYSAMQQYPECKEAADRAMAEHNMAAGAMNELDKLPKAEAWAKAFSGFKDAVNGHISFEEGEVYSKARQCLSETQLREILANYKQEEQRVLATI